MRLGPGGEEGDEFSAWIRGPRSSSGVHCPNSSFMEGRRGMGEMGTGGGEAEPVEWAVAKEGRAASPSGCEGEAHSPPCSCPCGPLKGGRELEWVRGAGARSRRGGRRRAGGVGWDSLWPPRRGAR